MATIRYALLSQIEHIYDVFPRHEFYETDEVLTLSIFDRGADPTQVNVNFEDRRVHFCSFDPSMSSFSSIPLGVL